MEGHDRSAYCQAEENVVCNFKRMTTQVSHCCHLDSRSAATDAGVHLPHTQGLAVHSLFLTSSMPGAPTRSTADNTTAARQKVGPPSLFGGNPGSYFLKSLPNLQRMDTFNGMISLYVNGRLFQQKSVREEFWTEDPTTLTELLVKDGQWYEQHFRKVSKMTTTLLRHSSDEQFRNLRRNRIQGDIVLIDLLPPDRFDEAQLSDFTSCLLVGLGSLHGEEALHLRHCQGYQQPEGRCQLFVDLQPVPGGKRVDPATYELVTGHSFMITRRSLKESQMTLST